MAKHPLNEKYIVYRCGIQDCADEGWAMALYRLVDDKMESIYFPESSFYSDMSDNSYKN